MNGRQAGMAMVEVAIGAVVLIVGLLALIAGLLASSRVSVDIQTNDVLRVATQNTVKMLQDSPFASIPFQYGAGTNQEQFWCDLEGRILFTDPGNATVSGTIGVFNDESDLPADFADMGGSADLNANGVIDNGPISNYRLLPVRVSFEIQALPAARTVIFDVMLVEKES